MTLPQLCDFYWAAQGLSLEGEVTGYKVGGEQVAGSVAGSSFLDLDAYQMLVYQPRFVFAEQTSQPGAYDFSGTYVFSQPLHWDGLDGTFCPEMVLTLMIGHDVSPQEPENLGRVSTDPSIGEQVGYADLLMDFHYGLRLPLYYEREGVLRNVSATARLTGTRWVFAD